MKRDIEEQLKQARRDIPVNDVFLKKLHGDLEREGVLQNPRSDRVRHRLVLRTAAVLFSLLVLTVSVRWGTQLFIGNHDEGIDSPRPTPIEPQIVQEQDAIDPTGLVLLYADRKVGFMDLSGKVIIEPQFDYASSFNQYGVATVMLRQDGREQYGLVGPEGLLTEVHLWDIGPFQEGLARAKTREGKYGYLDTAGKWLVEPVFDRAEDFSEGMAAVSQGDLWGYIDRLGRVVVPPQYESAASFQNGLAWVKEPGDWRTAPKHYLNAKGERVITLPDWVIDASDFAEDGTALITVVDSENQAISHMGVINRQGELLLPLEFSALSGAVDGLRVAMPGEGSTSAKAGMYNRIGIINENGHWVVQPQYFEMGVIRNGLVRASIIKNGRQQTGILRTDGTWLYEPNYVEVFSFTNDMVAFIEDSGYHGVGVVMSLYDLEGHQLLGGQTFNHIEILSEEYIRCGTMIDQRRATMAWRIYHPDGREFMPGSNMRTALTLPDGNVLATVLREDAFYQGIVNPVSEEWVLEPVYYEILRYREGAGAGVRVIAGKSNEEQITFVIDLFDASGNVTHTTEEETMTSGDFYMIEWRPFFEEASLALQGSFS